jgi:hypothetical protein
MRMFMSNGIMSVNVRMRLHDRTLMRVPVEIIVNVQMVVLDRLVGVSVAVSFPNEKEYTGYHEVPPLPTASAALQRSPPRVARR